MADLASTKIYGTLEVADIINSTGAITAPKLILTQTTGTAPMTVTSTTLVSNLNADLLDGQQGTYYAVATHGHGNISNTGYVGSTPNLPLITGTNGIITTLPSGTTSQFLRGDGIWSPIQLGTENVDGILKLATVSETVEGINTTKSSTPAGVKAALKSIEGDLYSAILYTSNWVGSSSPYYYTISISGITSDSNVHITEGSDITASQMYSLHLANITSGSLSTDTVIIKALGIKPDIDIPINIIVSPALYIVDANSNETIDNSIYCAQYVNKFKDDTYPECISDIAYLEQDYSNVLVAATSNYYDNNNTKLYKSYDLGYNWEKIDNSEYLYPIKSFKNIKTNETTNGLLANSEIGLYRSTDINTWTPVFMPNSLSFDVAHIMYDSNTDKYYSSTDSLGNIYVSSDVNVWSIIGNVGANNINSYISIAANGNIMVSSNYNIYLSTDHGVTWTSVLDLSANTDYIAEFNTSSVNVIAVTHKGKIYKSTNSGTTWTLSFDTGQIIFPNNEYLAGTGGLGQNHPDCLINLTADIILLLTGTLGYLYRSTDYGSTWSKITIGSDVTLNIITKGENGVVLLLTSSCAPYKSIDNGATWNLMTVHETLYPLDFTYTTTNTFIASMTDGGSGPAGTFAKYLYITTDNGSTWSSVLTVGTGILNYNEITLRPYNPPVYKLGDDSLLAVFNLSIVYESINNGATWTNSSINMNDNILTFLKLRIPYDTYSAICKLNNHWFISTDLISWNMNNPNLANANTLISSIINTDDSNILASGKNGVLYKSADYGETWSLLTTINTTAYESFLLKLGNNIYFIEDSGIIYKSIDNGSTWSLHYTLTLMNADIDYVSHTLTISDTTALIFLASGKTYKTTDSGDNWIVKTTALTNSVFSTSAVLLPDNNILLSGSTSSACGIYKSTNFGESWSLVQNIGNSNTSSIECLTNTKDNNAIIGLNVNNITDIFKISKIYANINYVYNILKQYSSDKISWHTNYTESDIWYRYSYDNGINFEGPYPITGYLGIWGI